MNEVLDAGSFQLIHTLRCSCYDIQSTAIEILECRDGIGGILLVARTEHNDIGLCLQCCIYTLFNGIESKVVDNLIACTSQEVGTKLCASLTPCEFSDGKHEYGRCLSALLGLHAQCLEVTGQTAALNLLERRTVMTATTSAIIRLFPVALLREVRELVGAEEELFTFTNRLMTFLVGCVDSILNDAFLCSLKESSLFF